MHSRLHGLTLEMSQASGILAGEKFFPTPEPITVSVSPFFRRCPNPNTGKPETATPLPRCSSSTADASATLNAATVFYVCFKTFNRSKTNPADFRPRIASGKDCQSKRRQPPTRKRWQSPAPAKHGTGDANPKIPICKPARRPHR
jgi:hypothetical protein